MGDINLDKVVKAKLFCALMFEREEDRQYAENELTKEFGKIELSSNIYKFNHTDYYCEEFGCNLKKKLIVFEKTVEQEILPDIKIKTNEIEDSYLTDKGNRRVNIDPGFILPSKLILASTKNYSHRIYLGKGIYAEVTLMFTKKGVKYLEWTYPDYRSEELAEFLIEVRQNYIKSLKKQDK
ncbi:MAG: DUF4416 family protein [Candidatus Schekmanbacteria bacterium]|nr:MAG: DUF4416 family protein [Candidatus Schekmanbacteria bacterium]